MLRNGKDAGAARMQQVRGEKDTLEGTMQGLLSQGKKVGFQPKCNQTPGQIFTNIILAATWRTDWRKQDWRQEDQKGDCLSCTSERWWWLFLGNNEEKKKGGISEINIRRKNQNLLEELEQLGA